MGHSSVKRRELQLAILAILGIWSVCSGAVAQDAADANGETPTEMSLPEGPDPTRLDVERLPPEAIEVDRDLYASGWVVEGWLGGRGFVGTLGEISNPGPYANVGLGFEWFHWLSLRVALEASLHETRGPGPPSPTAFELLGALVEVRAQLNFSATWALWVQAEGGGLLAFGDVLRTFGLDQSGSVSLQFGGSAGLDWHFDNKHTSIGLTGGARLYPGLAGPSESLGLGVHGAFYIRNVL